MPSKTFEARITCVNGFMDEVTVWIYEQSELDPTKRSYADWIRGWIEYSRSGWLNEEFDLENSGAFVEIIFKGELWWGTDWKCCGDEYDERIEVTEYMKQDIPEGWFG